MGVPQQRRRAAQAVRRFSMPLPLDTNAAGRPNERSFPGRERAMQRRNTPVVFIIVLSVFACCAPGVAGAGECQRWEQQRERAQQQLRRPHSAAQANRLKARIRELHARIAHDCR
jgi:hypothetical protein